MNYLLKPNEATRSMFRRGPSLLFCMPGVRRRSQPALCCREQFEIMERTDILKIGIQVQLCDFFCLATLTVGSGYE